MGGIGGVAIAAIVATGRIVAVIVAMAVADR